MGIKGWGTWSKHFFYSCTPFTALFLKRARVSIQGAPAHQSVHEFHWAQSWAPRVPEKCCLSLFVLSYLSGFPACAPALFVILSLVWTAMLLVLSLSYPGALSSWMDPSSVGSLVSSCLQPCLQELLCCAVNMGYSKVCLVLCCSYEDIAWQSQRQRGRQGDLQLGQCAG